MHPFLEDILALSREKASTWLDSARALQTVAADVGQYAVGRLHDLRHGGHQRESDPVEAVLNQVVLELSYGIIEAKKRVAVSIADMHRLTRLVEQERANVAEWALRAAQAAGEAGVAAEARARFSEHTELARTLAGMLTLQTAEVDGLKKTLRALNEQVERAKRDKNRIVARRQLAHSNETLRLEIRRLDEVVRLLDRLSTLAEPLNEPDADPKGPEALH